MTGGARTGSPQPGRTELAEQSERMHQVASVAQRRLRANYGWAGA